MHTEKGFSAKLLVLSIAVMLIIFAGVAYIIIARFPTAAPITATTGQPTEKITDLAPSLPNNEKTAVVVMHSDSSYEKFIIPNTTVDTYTKSLPEGDKVISQTPLSQ